MPPKTVRTLIVMLVALAVPYARPEMRRLRIVRAPWDARDESASISTGDPSRTPATSSAAAEAAADPRPDTAGRPGEQALPASENLATIHNALPSDERSTYGALPAIPEKLRAALRRVPVEDPSHHALDAFFARLAATDRKEPGAVTRVLHYGDSIVASDYVSGTVRRRLQARFGDAGHGFILVANPWQWYFHNDVMHASGGGWYASRLTGPFTADGMYGLGGVSFVGYAGAVAWFGTATQGDFGRRASRFDLHYLEQPSGGTVEMTAFGRTERFSTRGDTKIARVHTLHVDDGEARLTLRSVGGPVRVFGVVVERDGPGVVYDALGAQSVMATYWERQNREHWAQEMALRDPALVVLQYGTNESEIGRFDADAYERSLGALVDEVRAVAPRASVLLVSPPDRAEMYAGRLRSKAVIAEIVASQRRVAAAHGAAFFSTFDAMGGAGAMPKWVNARPRLGNVDMTHPTPLGAEVLGDLLADALLAAYDASTR